MCMIDSNASQLIELTVTQWVQQSRAFTGFEVTLEIQRELRARGDDAPHHRDIRNYYRQDCQALRDAIQSGQYTSTIRPMGSGVPDAFVYHPVGYDATQYQPLDRGHGRSMQISVANIGTVPNTATLAPILTTNMISIGSNGTPRTRDPNVAEVNKSGELWVGVPHVQNAGFHPGDIVDVTADSNGVVTLGTPTGGIRTKQVEREGNLRLYAKERTDLGLTGTRFKVESEQGKVTVSA